MENRIVISNETEELIKAIEEYIEENLEGDEFLVCDEAGRQKELEDNIKESLWAFNANFIVDHMSTRNNFSYRERQEVEKAIKEMQEKLCESANYLIMAMIEDLEAFIDDAEQADGAGHFLNPYDGEETEFSFNGETYYIYRTN